MNRQFWIISMGIFLALAACKKPHDTVPVTVVLDWVVNTNHTGLYVALDRGYFDDVDLDVTIEFPPEIGANSLLLSDKAQFAFSYQEDITYARIQGVPLKAIATVLQHNTSGFASLKAKNILTPEDFVGKTYGGWGSPIEDALLRTLLKKSGGNTEDIQSIAIGSMDFFAATASGIDFMWIFEGWDGVAASQKGIPINFIRLSDIDPALDYYTPVLVATDTFISENQETVSAFLEAVSRGYEFTIQNPLEASEILVGHAPELDYELVRESLEYLSDYYKADAKQWGFMREEVWDNFANWMRKNGLLEGKFNTGDAFTNAFLP